MSDAHQSEASESHPSPRIGRGAGGEGHPLPPNLEDRTSAPAQSKIQNPKSKIGLSFDARLALGPFTLDAAFEARAGETLALVGPSGSGKSTCLGLIAGFLRPDDARIVLGDTTLCDTSTRTDLPPEARHVGLLFQEYALFPHLSVRENVAYGARARRMPRPEVGRRVTEWLERLRIGEYADTPVTRLSGGQRQRVALARALASGPRALLLDEPFGALDVSTRSAVRAELRAFLAGVDLPTVVVTHDPLDALVFGDRIAALENGRIAQLGTKEEMLTHPRSPFVAELIGLNLYEAVVDSGAGLKEARVGGTVFHVLADGLSGTAYLAFSPAEVALSADAPSGSPQNVFPGVVREILPLPDRLRVVLDVGVTLTAEVTRESTQRLHIAAGQRLWASIKATAIRVYA